MKRIVLFALPIAFFGIAVAGKENVGLLPSGKHGQMTVKRVAHLPKPEASGLTKTYRITENGLKRIITPENRALVRQELAHTRQQIEQLRPLREMLVQQMAEDRDAANALLALHNKENVNPRD